MRCYHFCNMYLSSIQHGIQSAHAQMELFVKYSTKPETSQYHDLFDWAINHKTMICLNGGMHVNMTDILRHVSSDYNPHPWSFFHEDEDAAGGLLTNIAIVLPSSFYDNIPAVLSAQANNHLGLLAATPSGWSSWHLKMAELMGRLRLAQ